MGEWLRALDPSDVTLFCQDWGGLIGLRLVAAEPERFARVVASNTFLPTGDAVPSEAFLAWRKFSQEVPVFPTGGIIQGGTARGISDAVRAGYDAPYPDESFKAGARAFPPLVPVSLDDPAAPANKAAWQVLERFDRPFLTLFGDSDPVTAGADRLLQARIPGAAGQPHRTIVRAGHFIQEDAGEELAYEIAKRDRVSAVGGAAARSADTERALGYVWSADGREALYLKSRVVMAARAAGKAPIEVGIGVNTGQCWTSSKLRPQPLHTSSPWAVEQIAMQGASGVLAYQASQACVASAGIHASSHSLRW